MSKPFKIARLILKLTSRRKNRENALGDMEEFYDEIAETSGVKEADKWIWKQALKSIPDSMRSRCYWGGVMFKNHFKIGIRNILRQKLFTAINVFGLAVGIAVCMMIYLWVQNELSYDQFHSKADRIYRIERELFRDEVFSRWPITGGMYKQALIDDYPEVVDAVRVWGREFSIKDDKNNIYRQEMYAVDNSVFNIFDYPLLYGDESTALEDPRSIVLTEDLAMKYFGRTNVVGKTLQFEWERKYTDFTVTGVLRQIPKNSHIHFNMLLSFSTYDEEDFKNWRSNYLYTYVLLDKGISTEDFEPKLKMFVEQHLEPNYGDILIQGVSVHEVLKMHIFPITDIHLNPSENWEQEPGGSISTVYLFLSVAFLVLLIAGINFTNLTTARANKRAKEVSLRKTIGACNKQLRYQFLQESLFLTLISSVVAMFVLYILITYYNYFFNSQLSFSGIFDPRTLLLFVVLIMSLGVIAGLYPAFYLTRFEPADVLKGGVLKGRRKSGFRRNMVIVQFSISIALMIGVSVMYNQMEFIQTRSIGFEKENIIVLRVRGAEAFSQYEAFRNNLMNNEKIVSVSASADIPGDQFFSNGNIRKTGGENMHASMEYMFCDYDYLKTYGMKIIAGREFSREFSTDTAGTIILNETGAKRLGYTPEEAVGKLLIRANPNAPVKVVGVVEDFNFKTMRREIEPLALILLPEHVSSISIKTAPGDIIETINMIEGEYHKVFSEEAFEFTFLEERLNQLYESDRQTQTILIVFSSLSILIACLGLFGLAAFTSEEKTKEIGIRKTLGASVIGILGLLVREYLKWVVISAVIAIPVAYFLMENWLQNYAYRVEVSVWVFIVSILAALIITVVTVAFQTVKSSLINPVDTLRSE